MTQVYAPKNGRLDFGPHLFDLSTLNHFFINNQHFQYYQFLDQILISIIYWILSYGLTILS